MADDRYYRDQPRFERKDPLDRWSWIFLGLAGLALLWFLVIIWLTATDRIGDDGLFGQGEAFWVGISTVAVIVAILGLIFVIVGRLGATSGGSYLSADLDRSRAAPPSARAPVVEEEAVAGIPEDEYIRAASGPTQRPAARIDDPFGPDGRMLLSYTVPEEQLRGIYGDAWVPVDTDTVLNVKTLLAKTIGGTRGD